MKNALSMSVAAAVVACAGSAAMADFFVGQSVTVTGTAGPQFPTTWGTGFGGGTPHNLGGSNNYVDPFFTAAFVVVTSQVLNVNLLSLTVDFTNFGATDFTNLTINVPDLKTDGTILSVFASQGTVVVNPDGNGFSWSGSGTITPPIVTFEIVQSPTPGAAALLGLGSLAAARRRR